jgi:hypothetical protein
VQRVHTQQNVRQQPGWQRDAPRLFDHRLHPALHTQLQVRRLQEHTVLLCGELDVGENGERACHLSNIMARFRQ